MKNHHAQENMPQIPHPVVSAGGAATHVMVPIDEYLSVFGQSSTLPAGYVFVPREVSYRVAAGENPLRAWRKYKKLTQDAMARLMSVTRPAYTQMEQSESPHRATLEKAAAALEIDPAQLVELYDDYPASVPGGAS
jgi:DNA-binding XRE family transcriptional regulator